MKNISKALASVTEGFLSAISNASWQTESGKQLIKKYQSISLANAIDCNIVNNFIKEAKQITYDNGVLNILELVNYLIEDHKYGWLLESACEQIERNKNTYSYLNRNAAKLVRPLLEMEESDIVSYIKAGALKDAMYCESIRNICKSVYKNTPIVENNKEFDAVHPVSYLERDKNKIFFNVEGVNYLLSDNTVKESTEKRTNEYNTITSLMNSNIIKVNNGTINFDNGNFSIQISEAGKIKKNKDGKVYEYTTDQFREHNSLLSRNFSGKVKNNLERILESLTKLSENFNNIAVLDNSTIFTTKNDRFIVFENNGKAYAKLLNSKKYSSPWSIDNNIYEVVNFIKSKTNCDLSEYYSKEITSVIKDAEHQDAKKIEESIKNQEIQKRAEKIEELTQRFKNDPIKLAVLSKVAADLNTLR